jgi:hypothetical protein
MFSRRLTEATSAQAALTDAIEALAEAIEADGLIRVPQFVYRDIGTQTLALERPQLTGPVPSYEVEFVLGRGNFGDEPLASDQGRGRRRRSGRSDRLLHPRVKRRVAPWVCQTSSRHRRGVAKLAPDADLVTNNIQNKTTAPPAVPSQGPLPMPRFHISVGQQRRGDHSPNAGQKRKAGWLPCVSPSVAAAFT